MVDGNLDVYPSFLGKYGYSILTFESPPRNSYIIYKNYLHLNKNSNIIIINKNLNGEEKTGKGMALCYKKEKIRVMTLNVNKAFEVKLWQFLIY